MTEETWTYMIVISQQTSTFWLSVPEYGLFKPKHVGECKL
jgi:hypothetical protein